MGAQRVVGLEPGRVVEHVGRGDAADVPVEAALAGDLGGAAQQAEVGHRREIVRFENVTVHGAVG